VVEAAAAAVVVEAAAVEAAAGAVVRAARRAGPAGAFREAGVDPREDAPESLGGQPPIALQSGP